MSIDVITLAASKKYTDKQIEKASIKGVDLSGYVQTVNGIAPDENGNVQIATGSGSGVDVTAKPGQTIRVKEVDENGKPTAWEAADFPEGGSGGGEEKKWIDIIPEMATGEVSVLTIDTDSEGNPFSYNELYMMGTNFGHTTDNTLKNTTVDVRYNGNWERLCVLKISDYSRMITCNLRVYNRGGYYNFEFINGGANFNPEPQTMYGMSWNYKWLSADIPITGIRFSIGGELPFHSTSKIRLRGR